MNEFAMQNDRAKLTY